MTDEIIHSKLEYMELLFEHQNQGLTTTEIVENYFLDIDQKAVSMALKRLVYRRDAVRVRTPDVAYGYTYFLNQHGFQKMRFLQDRNELEDDFEEEDEEDPKTISELEDEILRLKRKRDRL